jgi:NAD(P)-dependent dehydrogenase (short-subunit alcohol dehydrogenase family)
VTPVADPLSGHVALVTGAGQGVGEGIAHELARQGAAVAVNDFYPERAERVADAIGAAGGRAVAAPADVRRLDDVLGMVGAVERDLGPVDVLVNNAGVPADGFVPRPFREMAPEDWARFIDLNLYGVLNCAKAVLDGMCDRGWGRVVTVSSEAGRMGMPTGISLYGTGKAGALGFSRHLAAELVATGVTVNSVALGLMTTGSDDARRPPWPTARLGTPDDVAGAVCFLASDAASWITGQVLGVNGGAAML